MSVIDMLESVLCGPDGKCCLAGSDTDRAIVDTALTALLAAAQPVEPSSGWAKGLEIRMSQGWKLKGGICPVLYSDTVNGYGVGRDDLWLATTDALKSAQPVEVQRVGLTDEEIQEKITEAVKNQKLSCLGYKLDAQGFYTIPMLSKADYQAWRVAEAAHGIKPASSEGGAA